MTEMKRILIIGCCGCGKTTLSRQLSQRLQLPLIHLDQLNWRDNWQPVPRETFDALLAAEVNKPAWIIDGNYNRTLPLRLQYCDTVIYMDYPRILCLWGVLKRVVTGYGKSRSDMGGNCPESFDCAFLSFVWTFNIAHSQRYPQMIKQEPRKRVIILRSRRETHRFLSGL